MMLVFLLVVFLLFLLAFAWPFLRSDRVFRFRARGKFYFGFGDLLFALWRLLASSVSSSSSSSASASTLSSLSSSSFPSSSSFSARAVASASAEQWMGGSHVALAALSARTAFDLWLQAKALPRGTEIIFSSVNIKDMILIAKHHGLQVVPLDVDLDTMQPKIEQLAQLVTPKTRVLLVAHIFGTRFDMTPWVRAAKEHNLLLVEDCAESFDGVYKGSTEADLVLFSFGAIKTCSALGGSVSRVRDAEVLSRMRTLHSAYPLRSKLAFAKRLLSYAVLCALQRPLILGAAVRLLEMAGGDFETLLTNAVRGFAGSELITGIRHQAPVAMLELLARKLSSFDADAVIGERVRLGKLACELLGDGVFVPGRRSKEHCFWLFPVLAKNAGVVIAALRRAGVDATQGTTQLASVPLSSEGKGFSDASRLMWRNVVYLPVYPGMDDCEIRSMAHIVRSVAVAPSLSSMSRPEALKLLERQAGWDVLVVGGGINGAAVARDAAMRGLSVALVERVDFAAGASGNSAKLVHGGFRYVERLQLGLVSELCHERDLLRRLNPHLVRASTFLLPMRASYGNRMAKIGIGLWLYDACAAFANGVHRRLTAAAATAREPLLGGLKDLVGAFVYTDCWTDDTRLTLGNIRAAAASGAVVLNHCSYISQQDKGVFVCQDELTGVKLTVRARHLVLATGSDLDRFSAVGESLLEPAKGIHLAVPKSVLPVRSGCVGFQSPDDRRWCFCVPYSGDLVVVGTTETLPEGSERDGRATRGEVEYLLAAIKATFGVQVLPSQVSATWSGMRPLLARSKTTADRGGLLLWLRNVFFKLVSQSSSGSGGSREDKIVQRGRESTLIAGGKLTPYRSVAERTVDLVVRALEKPTRPCLTREVGLDERVPPVPPESAYAQHLYWSYGSDADWIERRVATFPKESELLCEELPHRLAEVSLAVLEERAETLEDVLVRRVPLAILAKDNGASAAEKVVRHMAVLMKRDPAWQQKELETFRRTIQQMHQWKLDKQNDRFPPNLKL